MDFEERLRGMKEDLHQCIELQNLALNSAQMRGQELQGLCLIYMSLEDLSQTWMWMPMASSQTFNDVGSGFNLVLPVCPRLILDLELLFAGILIRARKGTRF